MDIDVKQLALAVRSIAEEKNLPEDVVQEIVEQALAAAYKRDHGDREQQVRVSMNMSSGETSAYVTKTVVDKVENEYLEISLEDAKKLKKDAKVDDEVEIFQEIKSFGRVAAQTAKQVVLQRLREAEREIMMEEYEDKIGTVVNGIVSRIEGSMVRIDLGRAQAIMPRGEQIQNEHYHPGQRLKVYLREIERGNRGPQLVVSRGNTQFVEWLFRAEVPEMESGAVEIKAIAREPGTRTKIAVASTVPGVDPVGTFVGGHGARINAVMSEIGDQEKIDIVVWDDDIKKLITNALSPTEVTKVELDEANKKCRVIVAEDQLSVAIGRGGQNVRLASKLAGYEIDIVSATAQEDEKESTPVETEAKPAAEKKPVKQGLKKKSELESSLLEAIEEHGE